jgi:O-methyltransferase involved in polyketide biosynthesis
MEEGQVSQTAIGSAMQRAAHFALDGEPKILEDHLALDLAVLSEDDPRHLNSGRHQRYEFRQLRAFMALRNHMAEDEVARNLASREGQYVILGAGLDSFAYRSPSSLRADKHFKSTFLAPRRRSISSWGRRAPRRPRADGRC